MRIKHIILPLCLCVSVDLLAAPKVLHVADYGFAVENTATINATKSAVWKALTEEVDNWWPKDHTWWGAQGTLSIDTHAGGCFCEISGVKSAEHMRISFVEPSKLLRMTGGLGPLQGMGLHGALDWQLSEKDGVTKVTLTYRVSGYSPEGYEKLAPIVAQVQGLQLQGLVDYGNVKD